MPSHPEPTPGGANQSAPKRSTAPTGAPQRKQEQRKKLANGIVALSSAAIIAVYAAGYLHTAPAAASVANVAPTALVASVATTSTATAASLLTPTASAAVAASATYKDGTYTGSGTSKHGGVTVAVTIKNGAIASAAITASNTRYPISRIAALPGAVVAAQSAGIDFVSGATDSSMAFQTAVASALALAKGA